MCCSFDWDFDMIDVNSFKYLTWYVPALELGFDWVFIRFA